MDNFDWKSLKNDGYSCSLHKPNTYCCTCNKTRIKIEETNELCLMYPGKHKWNKGMRVVWSKVLGQILKGGW